MPKGVINWFNEAKGFGFIKQDDGADVFVHCSSIAGEGPGNLPEGQEVAFEVVQGAQGLHAANLVRL